MPLTKQQTGSHETNVAISVNLMVSNCDLNTINETAIITCERKLVPRREQMSGYQGNYKNFSLILHQQICKPQIWGQSYKTFYTFGQIYKRTLKHVNNAMQQTFVHHNVRTLHPNTNIFNGLHFSFSQHRKYRHFILHCPEE